MPWLTLAHLQGGGLVRLGARLKHTLGRLFCLAALVGAAFTVQAAEIAIRNAQLAVAEEAYILSAEFGLTLNGRLEEAVNKGVVLHFVIDFELSRSRWYWFDEQVVRRHKTMQLAYHALTRQYRVSVGGQHQTYASLSEALRAMSRLSHWPVLEKGGLRLDEPYQAGLMMRLDLSQMPKTFQVSALSSKEWTLSSGWLRWSFLPREAVAAPPVDPPYVPVVAPLPELPAASAPAPSSAPGLSVPATPSGSALHFPPGGALLPGGQGASGGAAGPAAGEVK